MLTPRTGWRRLRRWFGGIAVRSAAISGAAVLAGLVTVGALSVVALHEVLTSDVDHAAAARARTVAQRLREEPPDELDAVLLATDQGIVSVQVLDAHGVVLRRSESAPESPLIPVPDHESRVGVPSTDDDDVRVSAAVVTGREGDYTVLVGGGIEPVETMVSTVAVMLAVTAPVVAAVAAGATYLLVRRSLRSVDAIRSRVSAISASDLAERVPVPYRSDEVAALAVTMNDMLARIEAGHVAQRRFVGDASHELRSPLSTVISGLEIGAAHPQLVDAQMVQSTLLPEAYRMQNLVEDLLLLARADERGLPLRRADVDLDDLAAQEVRRLQRQAGPTVAGRLEPVRVVGDAQGIARVLRNLVDNAVRYAAGEVLITVRSDGGRAYLQVDDDGPGIAVADRRRVFERFVRLDEDRSRAGGGTGLGLAIVAEVVAAHGGTVVIGDRSGGGTRVTVQLPAANSPDSKR